MALLFIMFSSAKFLLFPGLEAFSFLPLDAWVLLAVHHYNGNPSGCATFENMALDTCALHILHSWMQYPHVVTLHVDLLLWLTRWWKWFLLNRICGIGVWGDLESLRKLCCWVSSSINDLLNCKPFLVVWISDLFSKICAFEMHTSTT